MTLNELYKEYKKVADTLTFYLKDNEQVEYRNVSFAELTRSNGAFLKPDKKGETRYNLTRPQLAQLLGNMYCDAEEIIVNKDLENMEAAESQRDKCLAAWMCFYWYRTLEWKSSSASLKLEEEEFAQVWLYHCIDACLYYRSWRPIRIDHQWKKKTGETKYIPNPQYKPEEENQVDKSMNHWISVERARRYQEANKDKRKINQMTVSFSVFEDEDGDSTLDRNPLLAEEGIKYNPVEEISTLLTRKGKVLEALVIEALAYGNSVKQVKNKDSEELTNELSLRGVSKYIKEMSCRELNEFAKRYKVEKNTLSDIISKLSPKKVKEAFEVAKQTLIQQESEVRSILATN